MAKQTKKKAVTKPDTIKKRKRKFDEKKTPKALAEIVRKWVLEKKETPDDEFPDYVLMAKRFFKLATPAALARRLGIKRRQTIYDWCKKSKAFKDEFEVWQTKREDFFVQLAPYWTSHPAMFIFLAKNWLGMSDKIEQQHTGEQTIIVRHIDRSKTE